MMYHYLLYIEVQFRPEVIERILRVVRHRGFMLYTLHVSPCNQLKDRKLHIHLIIIGKRSINILREHLKKLVDISAITVLDNNQDLGQYFSNMDSIQDDN